MRSVREISQRLLVFQHEFVDRHLRMKHRRVARIFGVTQEVGFGRELEAAASISLRSVLSSMRCSVFATPVPSPARAE